MTQGKTNLCFTGSRFLVRLLEFLNDTSNLNFVHGTPETFKTQWSVFYMFSLLSQEHHPSWMLPGSLDGWSHDECENTVKEGSSRSTCTINYRLFILYCLHHPSVKILLRDLFFTENRTHDTRRERTQWTRPSFVNGTTLSWNTSPGAFTGTPEDRRNTHPNLLVGGFHIGVGCGNERLRILWDLVFVGRLDEGLRIGWFCSVYKLRRSVIQTLNNDLTRVSEL